MGNNLSSGGPTDVPLAYLASIPEYVHQQTLGLGKTLKSLMCLHEEGQVVIKLYIKRDASFSLAGYEQRLQAVRDSFSALEQPSVLVCLKVEEDARAAFLVRQYFAYNLFDRFHSRPFLSPVEKRWMAFQVLTAVVQAHAQGVCHGDLKSENVMVTSWNWCFLTDFAFYKPTYLPANNPADYSQFFETSSRPRYSVCV